MSCERILLLQYTGYGYQKLRLTVRQCIASTCPGRRHYSAESFEFYIKKILKRKRTNLTELSFIFYVLRSSSLKFLQVFFYVKF